MTENGFPQARHSRLGEVTLWSAAALLMLSVHAGFAYYLMQEPEEQDAGGQPPAAIMIEMAAIPEAVKTEETTQAQDVEDTQEVKSDSSEPVEEAAPEEPPPPEPVAETPPPEPVQPPEPPVEEIVEPQEIPEPVEPIDPVQEQMMAELENVEVPLPVMRPPPPRVEKKVEKKEPEEKKKVERQRPKPQQASEFRETAKAEAQQSNRTAASRSNAGFFSSSSVSKADWDAKVRSAIKRRLARAAGKSGMAITVSFKIDSGGSVGGVSILSSTGNSAMDQKLLAVIQKTSVSPPPPGVNPSFTLPVLFE
ncbi:energy transducer TonB family protein [Agrobacterium fabrum]|uniref:energy transducer TonB family protein n=1 Tax=Agrobacterium fabrum TaxID=1176649 RepID=UPI0008878C81|nr:energy transducer TonB [Agrobacterium fabrum]MDH6293652.1 protein TonB [Agrobacterium fabrum]WLP53808.1 energy transducer TonB [Agrobacterium fabrum]SDB40831.1 protein TonB [Agrobacterium fabrum]SEQ78039.1 protein TonB [Agrobacterium fabrum]